MHRFETFTDLRANRDRVNGEITLWPSFTDIMTVVLMIFMLTMVVVIIKNTNLAQTLLQTEDQSRLLKGMLSRSQASLADLEEKLRQKEMRIMLITEESGLLKKDLENKALLISGMESETLELKNKVLSLDSALLAAETKAAEADEKTARITLEYEKQIDALQKRYEARIIEMESAAEKEKALLSEAKQKEIEEYNRRVLALLSQIKEKEAVILSLGDEKQQIELSLARQRQDYSSLEEKYIRLVRPARSTEGKKVATVSYMRKDGMYRIFLKGVDTEKTESLTMDNLHAQLTELQQKWRDQLYVKIIIPEDSGLTYNEAWAFTKDILSRYDYYYQNQTTE